MLKTREEILRELEEAGRNLQAVAAAAEARRRAESLPDTDAAPRQTSLVAPPVSRLTETKG